MTYSTTIALAPHFADNLDILDVHVLVYNFAAYYDCTAKIAKTTDTHATYTFTGPDAALAELIDAIENLRLTFNPNQDIMYSYATKG